MKTAIYEDLLLQVKELLAHEPDMIANLANVAALLHERLGHHWTGFYLAQGDVLVLGPFQGPVACTRIPKGKGVCGTAWSEMKTQVVPNVHLFEGHIACSSLSNSEIVVPIIEGNHFMGVLDIDSVAFSTFDAQDQEGLERIVSEIARRYTS